MADASHELRTPVTTTPPPPPWRATGASRRERISRDAEDRRTTTARLSRVVDDMFTLARADAGNYPMRSTPMYLDEVVEEIVRAARVVAATRDVGVEAHVVPSASFIGDEDLIRRMIVNLVDNAVRHSPAQSTVRVELDATNTGFAIAVKDQGSASPPRSGSRSSNGSSAPTRR